MYFLSEQHHPLDLTREKVVSVSISDSLTGDVLQISFKISGYYRLSLPQNAQKIKFSM